MEKGFQPPQTVTYMAPVRSGVTGINDDDPRYKCCCGAMHVKTGATVLAIVELALAALGVLGTIAGVGGDQHKFGAQGGSLFNGAVAIIVCSLMFYGLRKNKRYLLVPHMVFQVLAIVTCFSFAVVSLIGFIAVKAMQDSARYHEQHFQQEDKYRMADNLGLGVTILAVGAVIFCLIGVLEVWFFLVVLSAFHYLRDKERAGYSMVQYSGGNWELGIIKHQYPKFFIALLIMQQSSTSTAPCGVNDDDPRYKCCCGAMHVRTGATVLAIVELTLAAVGVLGAVVGTGDYRYKNGARGGSAFNSLVTIVICTLMIYGLRKTK